MTDLYLASRSPRRRDLLKQIGVHYEPLLLRLAQPRGPDIDEERHDGESPGSYVERVARAKAEFGMTVIGLRSMLVKPVLAADTEVVIDDDVIGKPANREQAIEFLHRLSGRTHEVRTSVALATGNTAAPRIATATSVSRVTLRQLTEAQIAAYCRTGEPYDKAGGYAIQGLAAVFVDRLEGSFSGVMGLPLAETADLLRQAGLPVL